MTKTSSPPISRSLGSQSATGIGGPARVKSLEPGRAAMAPTWRRILPPPSADEERQAQRIAALARALRERESTIEMWTVALIAVVMIVLATRVFCALIRAGVL